MTTIRLTVAAILALAARSWSTAACSVSTVAAILTLAAAGAHAQHFPAKTIRLVVPFPAGGATDTTARVVGKALQARLGQTVLVENIGGAGGSIAAKQVRLAPADGYTLMITATSSFGTQPYLYKLDYEPVKAFVAIASVVVDKSVLVAGPSLKVNTVQDLVKQAKASPGKLTYGSAAGIGPHFVMEAFKRKAGVDIQHIPYRGGGPMIVDLIGGTIHTTVNGKSVLRNHIASGKIRALAVAAAERWPDMKDVPTLVEAGYLDAPYDTLFGIVAPAGVQADIVEKLNATINDGLRSDEVRKAFAKLGIEPMITGAKEFQAIVAAEAVKWSKAAAASGIKVR